MSSESSTPIDRRFVFLPANSGGGVLVRRDEIIGARPNGQDGAIVYAASGPSIYTSLTTTQLANVVQAETIDPRSV